MKEHQEEIWKDIVIEQNGVIYDYTGLYQVSNLGRVRSLDRIDNTGKTINGRIMKLQYEQDKNNYVKVALYKDGTAKRFSVHRLVATAFIPNPDNLPVVNHKNEIKNDNRVENLEWCTDKYNSQYSSHKRKGNKNPRARSIICIETLQVFTTIKEAQEWLGKGNIIFNLQHKAKYAGVHPITGEPLHWMYYSDYLKLQEEENDK